MTKTLSERFNRKWMADANGCFLWIASINSDGYGQIKDGKRVKHAHRVSWELYVGPIPEDIWVLHKCDIRACVNPDHLFLGTHDDNMADMVAKGRSNTDRDRKGEFNGRAKLTEEQVLEIRAAAGLYREIAPQYGVSQAYISSIKNRKTWAHV